MPRVRLLVPARRIPQIQGDWTAVQPVASSTIPYCKATIHIAGHLLSCSDLLRLHLLERKDKTLPSQDTESTIGIYYIHPWQLGYESRSGGCDKKSCRRRRKPSNRFMQATKLFSNHLKLSPREKCTYSLKFTWITSTVLGCKCLSACI